MLLYYITDRRQFPGPEEERRRRLMAKIAEAARAGVDYIQLREKDLSAHELEHLAREAHALVRMTNPPRGRRHAALLVNARLDVALATGADGVHLPGDDLSADEARHVWKVFSGNSKRETRNFLVAVSCHSVAAVRRADHEGADLAVFGPVFEKVAARARPGVGLAELRQACHDEPALDPRTGASYSRFMPVLAVGGITLENAAACVEAGAAGIAAIRLFQENDIAAIVRQLRPNVTPPAPPGPPPAATI
ncbi:MAG TPA: thiamine phosphate synthase [Terriglobales bacterium]|jgi:thiamine-phosphate pyrophosphorylase|nr:thiamine phosphate synthase [Terriglobales bacterium]